MDIIPELKVIIPNKEIFYQDVEYFYRIVPNSFRYFSEECVGNWELLKLIVSLIDPSTVGTFNKLSQIQYAIKFRDIVIFGDDIPLVLSKMITSDLTAFHEFAIWRLLLTELTTLSKTKLVGFLPSLLSYFSLETNLEPFCALHPIFDILHPDVDVLRPILASPESISNIVVAILNNYHQLSGFKDALVNLLRSYTEEAFQNTEKAQLGSIFEEQENSDPWSKMQAQSKTLVMITTSNLDKTLHHLFEWKKLGKVDALCQELQHVLKELPMDPHRKAIVQDLIKQ